MQVLKKRVTPQISKNKVKNAIALYEKYVDEPIKSISIFTSTYYLIKGDNHEYSVDIANNKVEKSYPDPDY